MDIIPLLFSTKSTRLQKNIEKWLAATLAISFIMSTPLSAMAQENGNQTTTTENSSEEMTPPIESQTTDVVKSEVVAESGELAPEEIPPPAALLATDTPWYENRYVQQSKIKPDANGALSYQYPIVVPPGRLGMTPQLALQYVSSSGEDISPFGYAWSVNIPYIERLNKNGTEKLYSRSDFTSTMDGELYATSSANGVGGFSPLSLGAPDELAETPARANGTFKTWNSNGQVIDDTVVQEFHGKWVNYLSINGWQSINTDFKQGTSNFYVVTAPFEVEVPLLSNGVAKMRNNNRWDVFNKKEITDSSLDLSIQAQGIRAVSGHIERGDLVLLSGLRRNVSYVVYPDAYPGADLIYYVDFGVAPRLEKLIRFNAVPAKLQYDFKITYNLPVTIASKDTTSERVWSKKSVLSVVRGERVKVTKTNSTVRGIGFKQFQIWDSSASTTTDGKRARTIRSIDVTIVPAGTNSYVLTKIIPASFFASSSAPVYPVYTDTTATFYPDPNTEVTTVDGHAGRNTVGGTFIDTRSGAGLSHDDSSANFAGPLIGSANSGTGWWEIDRAFFLFDTSSIGGSNTISAATLSLYGASKNDIFSQSVYIVSSNPLSNTSLANADYARAKDAPVQSGTAITVASFSTAGYNDWTLNATGIASINGTGISKFGAHISADVNNVEPTISSNYGYAYPYYADQTGTTNDPKLTVVYAAPAASIEYAARVENGDFRRYTYASSTWTVKDKFGNRYTFGAATTSRIDNQNGNGDTFRWMLSEMRDPNNNYIKYTYYKDSGQIYPSTIVYTGNGATDGIFQVNFLRTARTDTATSSRAGFLVTDKYLIHEINTTINGTWVKKYALAYTSGANGRRSLLNSITESGEQEDASYSKTLPATTFVYTASTSGWTTNQAGVDSKWNLPTTAANYRFSVSSADNGSRLLDLNGDGLSDFVARNPAIASNVAALNNQQLGWGSDNANFHSPVDFITGTPLIDNGVRFTDVNGDGLVDIVHANNGIRATYFNTGTSTGFTGAVASTTWAPPADFITTSNVDFGSRIADINGDGLPDFITCDSSGVKTGTWLNSGRNGWSTTTFAYSCPMVAPGFDNDNSRLVEINGDGLPDIVISGGGLADEAYINTGMGWVRDNAWNIPVAFSTAGSNDSGTRFADVNGDGLNDILQSTGGATPSSRAYINNGYGWNTDFAWKPPIFITNDPGDLGVRIDDLDGNSLPDLIQYTDATTSGIYFNKSGKVDLLSTVTTNTGAQTAVRYLSTHKYFNTNGTMASPSLSVPLMTVGSTTLSDGLGTSINTSYFYEDGLYTYRGVFNRQMAGFSKVTEKNTDNNFSTKTYLHQGNGSNTAQGEYADDISKIGKPYRVEIYKEPSTIFDTSVNKWDMYDLGNSRTFVKLVQDIKMRYDGLSSHKDTANSFWYDNANGNQKGKTFWGEVVGADAGTFTDVGTDLATTTFFYVSSSTAYFSGPLSRVKTLDSASSTVKDDKFYYDSLAFGLVGKGNETKREMWKSGSTFASTTKTYDATYGMLTQQKDALSNATNFTIDSYNLYVATSTNALSQATGYTYDFSSGKVKNTFDANSRLFQTAYDPFDRISTTTIPDPNTGAAVTKDFYIYTDSGTPPASVRATSYLTAATSTDSYTYLDGLGRKIQERKEAHGTNTYAVRDFVYNNLGLILKESLPYFASSTANSAATTSSHLFTSYVYNDPLLRVSTTTTVLGSTSNLYANWTLTVTDPNGEIKNFKKDAYDNLIYVLEYATSTATTTYAYDLSKNLTRITDSLGNIRNFTYDGLNRRLTAEDLHVSGDTTFGTSTYSYDDQGNLTSRSDPKLQTINYTYDALNRILTEDYTGQLGTEVTLTYDTCADGRGRLCSATSTLGVHETYNALGLPKSERRIIDGSVYTVGYTYDRLGNIASTTYPDSSIVWNLYNNAGQLQKVLRKESTDASYTDVIRDTNYSPLGQVSFRVFGNWATTTNTYSPQQLYRLTRKLTTGISTSTAGLFSSLSFGGGEDTGQDSRASDGSIKDWNSKTIVNGEAATTEFHQKWIHYLSEGGWADISTEFVSSPRGFAMTAAPFEALVPLVATGTATMHNNNRYDVFNKSLITDAPLDLSITAQGVNPVAGHIEHGDIVTPSGIQKNVSYVVYPGAYENADLIYYVDFGLAPRLEKLIRFTSAPRLLQYSFALHYSEPVEMSTTGSTESLAKGDPFVVGAGQGLVVEAQATKRGIGFKPFTIWDSTTDLTDGKNHMNIAPIDVTITQTASTTYTLTKTIPNSFFTSSTTYPVYADTTSTFYPDPNTEVTSVDGMVERHGVNESWYAKRTGAGTASADLNAVETAVYLENSNGTATGWNDMTRAIFFFDTSAIGSTNTVDSGTVSLYGSSKGQSFDFGWKGVITTADLASNTAIVNADYQRAGNIGPALVSSATSTYTSWNIAGYNDYPLNAAGTAAVSKTGITKFGYQSNFDQASTSPPLGTGYMYMYPYFAEETGTTMDPKLTVVYTYYPAPVGSIQDIYYTYDAIGNITKIVNNSATDAQATTTYSYDDLHRLLSASTTEAANGANYKRTYTYNWLGNMTNGDKGAYAYTGNSGFNYANPHAPTTVGPLSYTYDKNGNMLTTASTTNTWDYRNRLATTVIGTTTTTYKYDNNDERTTLFDQLGTTTFPFPFYSVRTSTSTPWVYYKQIYAGQDLVATIKGSTTTAAVYYVHNDHLGGTDIVSNSSGTIEQEFSYYPFGGIRISKRLGSFTESRRYIGQEYDSTTDLSYLNARYMDPKTGQFYSQDPIFLGEPKAQDLMDPQQLNSYSYAVNNPITLKDPSGKGAGPLGGIAATALATIVALLYGILAILSSPEFQRATSRAGSGFLNQTPHIVQNIPALPGSVFNPPQTGGAIPLPSPVGVQPYNAAEGKGAPKPPKQFLRPTNPPQWPPSSGQVPPGHKIEIGPKTPQYPDGYWRQFDPKGQAIDPSTGKVPNAKTKPEFESKTHTPLPPGANIPSTYK